MSLLKSLSIICFVFIYFSPYSPKKENSTTYKITGTYRLNNEAIDKEDIHHLSEFGIDRDLVLVNAGGIKLLLENGEEYELTGDQCSKGRIYRVVDGKAEIIGISNINQIPIKHLTYNDIKNIRGINFQECPSKDFLEIFLSLNVDKVFIDSYDDTPVHPHAKYLEFSSIRDEYDFKGFLQTSSLLYLDIRYTDNRKVDCRNFINNKSLKHLRFDASDNVQALSSIKNLYSLDVGESEITDMSLFKQFSNLEKLHISRTMITDISPVKDIKKVSLLNMNYTDVKTLPLEHVPHLKKLNIRNTKVSLEDFQMFKELNPQCKISYSMNDQLQEALANIDFIRIRTGGTCHTDPKRQETIFEIEDKDKVKEFIANLQIEEEQTFHCQCCGSPSFEFYRDGQLMETLGFHHGHSIRWHKRTFGDAYLKGECIDYICKKLFDNGVKHHWLERLKDKEMEKIAKIKIDLAFDSLPKDFSTKLRNIKYYRELIPAYIDQIKDKETRIKYALRFLGVHQGSWNYKSIWDSITLRLLNNEDFDHYKIRRSDRLSMEEIIKVLKENKNDKEIIRGAIKWFFDFYDYDQFTKSQINSITEIIIEPALTHPRLSTRVKAMEMLTNLNPHFWSLYYLRKVLKGKYKPKELQEEKLEPRWWKSGGSGLMKFDEACSDFHYAAMFLAGLKDEQSIMLIEKELSSETDKTKKEALQEAADRYHRQW